MGRINWIASYPKSGNTWVRLFLHALHCLKEEEPDGFVPDGANSNPTFFQDNWRGLYEPELPMGWDAADKSAMAKARPIVHRKIAARSPGIFTGKTHNALIAVEKIPTVTPDVTLAAIYIVRHPFDVAISMKDHFGVKRDEQAVQIMLAPNYVQPKDARFVDAPIGSWMQHVQSWIGRPQPNILMVRYEDMLTDPGPVFSAIMRAYNYPDDPKMRDQALEMTKFSNLKAYEEQHGFVERPDRVDRFFVRGEAGHGQNLSRSLRRQIARAAGPLMEQLGYQA